MKSLIWVPPFMRLHRIRGAFERSSNLWNIHFAHGVQADMEA